MLTKDLQSNTVCKRTPFVVKRRFVTKDMETETDYNKTEQEMDANDKRLMAKLLEVTLAFLFLTSHKEVSRRII